MAITKNNNIPKFFEKVCIDDEDLRIREDARVMLMQRKTEEAIENEELQNLWVLLEKTAPKPAQEGQPQMIDYAEFKEIANLIKDPKTKQYFTAHVFGKLQDNDPQGRISILNLFNYIMRKTWLNQTLVSLSLYDPTGFGFLREEDLNNYIEELIPTLPKLNCLDKDFHKYYTCVAVRKFFFFLDPYKHGKIKILDILGSGFLDNVLELRYEDITRDREEENWFSAANTMRLYNAYLNLDDDQNGMLNKEELAKFNGGSLTTTFINRFFETSITYNGAIDFKTFVDFVLAMENRKEPQALLFLFSILDIKGDGYLDIFTLNYFFKAIQEKIKGQTQEQLNFEDICDEIFDMVKPKTPGKISLNDLIACGQAEIIINILIDVSGFLAYENRELQLIEVQEEAEV